MPLGRPKPVFGAWLKIPKCLVDVDQIKSDLTLQNPSFFKAGLIQGKNFNQMTEEEREEALKKAYILQFREDDYHIYVPRAYKVPGIRKSEYIYPERQYKHVTWPKDKIALGPHKHQPYDQKEAYEALVAPPNRTQGRLLVLGCGKGKTVISLKAAMKREVPIGVIVDTMELVRQWKARIKQYCRIDEKDIGQVGDGVFRWKGCPIVVMLTQTLMQERREWPEEFRRYFGLIILDEVHTLGAPVFSRVCPLFYGERWAMTATVVREDGLDIVFRQHTELDPCFVDVEQTLIPKVTFWNTHADNPDTYIIGPKHWKKRRYTYQEIMASSEETLMKWAQFMQSPDKDGKYPRVLGRMNHDRFFRLLGEKRRGNVPATLSTLGADEKRSRIISEFILKLEQRRRCSLVLGSRTENLIWFHNNYEGNSGLCYGAVDSSDRDKQLYNYPVVFAQHKLVSKGLDRVEFDTLVMLALDPMLAVEATVQQAVGRIQRENKKQQDIEVHIFRDANSNLLRGTYRKMSLSLRTVLGREAVIENRSIYGEEEL